MLEDAKGHLGERVMPKPDRLKTLYHQQKHREAKLAEKTVEMNRWKKEVNDERIALSKIESEIRNIANTGEYAISDHAVVRYMERVENFDMHELRKRLLPDKVREQHDELGDGEYPCGTHSVVIKDNKVVTVQI